MKKVIRPGLRGFELYAEVLHKTTLMGSERQLVLVNSGPQGAPVPFAPLHFQNRVMQEGDQVSLLIEVNGPGGMYAELGRIFSIGEPSQEMRDAMAVSVAAQELSLGMLKPGADPRELWDANNTFMEKNGYFPELRLYAHGQGYDLVERPLIRYDEPMKIQAGMNLTVHPTVVNDRVWVGVTDNYLVMETGVSECLHKTPKEIIVV